MKNFLRLDSFLGLLIALSFCIPNSVVAQKNRPVVDDAVTLLTLLKKDYSEITDQELRTNTIVKDRKQVINLLKAYIDQQEFAKKMAENLDSNSDKFKTFVEADIAINGITFSEPADYVSSGTSFTDLTEKLSEIRNSVTIINGKLNTKKVLEDPALYGPLKVNLADTIGSIEKREYIIGKYTLKTIAEYFAENGLNPYLEEISTLFLAKYNQVNQKSFDSFSTSIGATNVQKSVPFFGGGSLSFDEAIDGLARFLAKRFKEELTSQVFERIKRALSNPDSETDPFLELKILLPNTVKFITNLEHAELTGLLDVLKDHIETDLNNLVKQLPKLKDTPKIQRLIEKNEDLKMAIQGLDLLVTLSKSNHPLDFFDALAFSDLIKDWSGEEVTIARYNTAQGIKLTTLLINSLTVNVNEGRNWIQPEFWTSYAKELNFYKAFLGLVLQQDIRYYQIQLQGKPFADLLRSKHPGLTDMKELLEKIQPQVNRLLVSAEQLNNQIAAIKKLKRNNEKLSAEMLHQYVSKVIELMEGGLETVDVLTAFMGSRPIGLQDKMQSYLKFARTNNDILRYINQKKYAQAITTSLNLFYTIKEPEIDPEILALVRQVNKFHKKIDANEDYKLFKGVANSFFTNGSVDKNFVAKFIEFYKEVAGNAYFYSKIKVFDQDITFANHRAAYNQLKEIHTYINSITILPESLSMKQVEAIKNLSTLINGDLTIPIDVIEQIKGILMTDDEQLESLGVHYGLIRSIPTGADLLSTDENYTKLKAAFEDLIAEGSFIAKKMGLAILWEGVSTVRSKVQSEINRIEKLPKKRKGDKWKLLTYKHLDSTFLDLNTANIQLLKDFNTNKYRMAVSTAFAEIKEDALGLLYRLTTSGLSPELRSKIERYVSFLSAIARAETAEDAEKAIESLVLPAGSSSIKRNSMLNVALNSFPGILLAVESGNSDEVFTTSFTAPIGLAISGRTRRHAANTLYFTLMDIGAITRIRLNGDDSGELPNFTFKNLLAPGLYLIHGFRNSPLSLGVGAQFGPELQNAEGVSKSAIRFGVSFAVDIPLLNFYTRRN